VQGAAQFHEPDAVLYRHQRRLGSAVEHRARSLENVKTLFDAPVTGDKMFDRTFRDGWSFL
jgi:hypothetical protein